MKLYPAIATDFYFNGGRPYATGEIYVDYYYTDTIYKDTPSEKMIVYSNNTSLKTTTLTDGLYYHPTDLTDPGNEALRKANDYIREHANHFLEEAYEKIPEARNADEIIY